MTFLKCLIVVLFLLSLSMNPLFASLPAGQTVWVGNYTTHITRADFSGLCDDQSPVQSDTIQFDSWARTRAVVTHLCFEVYVAGVTDQVTVSPGRLDVSTRVPFKFPARFVEKRGNNYLYLVDLRDFDPVLHGSSISGNRDLEIGLPVIVNGYSNEGSVLRVRYLRY